MFTPKAEFTGPADHSMIKRIKRWSPENEKRQKQTKQHPRPKKYGIEEWNNNVLFRKRTINNSEIIVVIDVPFPQNTKQNVLESGPYLAVVSLSHLDSLSILNPVRKFLSPCLVQGSFHRSTFLLRFNTATVTRSNCRFSAKTQFL